MAVVSVRWRTVAIFLVLSATLFFYNEFVVYYVVLLQCTWPELSLDTVDFSMPHSSSEPLRAFFLSDTHLLGSREGHWFDKLRREWQMERTFQTAISIFNPDVVFVLGDLLDEGKWCSDAEFYDTVARFHRMFRHSSHTKMQVLVGNHDIGFHYMIDDHKRRRFASAFKAPAGKLLRLQDNIFVMLNSMAFEGDNCDMCRNAEQKLRQIYKQLNCAQGKIEDQYCSDDDKFLYTRPILLQHFPMYRTSDSNCSGPDSAPPEEKYTHFNPKWDCISKDASEKLFKWINPRLVISGHTHHFCQVQHENGIPEWTIPSFSWRYKTQPSFLLGVISSNNQALHKCYAPNERTVVYTYIVGFCFILLWLIFPRSLFLDSVRSLKIH